MGVVLRRFLPALTVHAAIQVGVARGALPAFAAATLNEVAPPNHGQL